MGTILTLDPAGIGELIGQILAWMSELVGVTWIIG